MSVLSGHGVIGFFVGGGDFDELCGQYKVGSGPRNERGDGDVLRGITLSVRDKDGAIGILASSLIEYLLTLIKIDYILFTIVHLIQS